MALTPNSADIPENAHLWRSLTQAKRDLSEIPHQRQREIALFLLQHNGLAKRYCEIITDFSAGEEPYPVAEDDDLAELLLTFWDDPVNELRSFSRDLAGQVGILGEQFVSIHVRESDGRLQLGYIDPNDVEAVCARPGNPRDQVEVHLKVPPGSPPIVFRIVRPNEPLSDIYAGVKEDGRRGPGSFRLHPRDPELVGQGRTYRTRERKTYDGACFRSYVNKLSNATRGVSDLFAEADYLDGLDKTVYNAVERSFMLNQCGLDVTVEGGDTKSLKDHEKAAKSAWGTPGGVYTHNEKVTAETRAADLKSADLEGIVAIVKLMILGSWGFPLHWFGDGGQANLATAGEMAGPTIRKLQSRQTVVRQMLRAFCDFQVSLKYALAPEEVSSVEDPHGYEITLPAITSKDTAREATATAQAIASVNQAWADDLITQLDAALIAQHYLSSMGDHEFSDLNPSLLSALRELSEAHIEELTAEPEEEETLVADPFARNADAPLPDELMPDDVEDDESE